MFKPTVGELLYDVRRGLEEVVLPFTGSGAAGRQLKASLQILRRLERTWDRLPSFLVADNDDVAATIRVVLARIGEANDGSRRYADLIAKLQDLAVAQPPPFISDLQAGNLGARNEALHGLLAELGSRIRRDVELDHAIGRECELLLLNLYARMLRRDANALGTSASTETAE